MAHFLNILCFLKRCPLLLLSGIFLSSYSVSETLTTHYYITDKSAAPLQMSTATPSLGSGIVTDILQALHLPNLDIEHRTLPFKRMIFNMKHSPQPWVSFGSAAWSGPQSLDLSSTPILSVQHQFLTRYDSHYQNIEDFFGETIILIRGFDYPGLEPYITAGKLKATFVNDHKAAIQSVLSKRGIAFPEMSSRLQYHLKRLKIPSEKIALRNISNLIPDYDINLCFSENFPKPSRDAIEAQLHLMQKNGQLDAIAKQYTM